MVPSYLKPATLDNGDVWSTPSQRLGTSSSELWNALSGRLRERKKAEWAAKWKSRAINKILQSALKIKPRKGGGTKMKLEKIKKKIQNRKTKNVGQLGVKSSSSCGHKIIQSYCDNSQDINHNFWRRGKGGSGLGLGRLRVVFGAKWSYHSAGRFQCQTKSINRTDRDYFQVISCVSMSHTRLRIPAKLCTKGESRNIRFPSPEALTPDWVFHTYIQRV